MDQKGKLHKGTWKMMNKIWKVYQGMILKTEQRNGGKKKNEKIGKRRRTSQGENEENKRTKGF